MYTRKLTIKTSSVNAWRSLCWWPDLSDCLVTSFISQGWPQKKPADHNCCDNGEARREDLGWQSEDVVWRRHWRQAGRGRRGTGVLEWKPSNDKNKPRPKPSHCNCSRSRAIHNAALNSSGDLLCYPQTICWREKELKLNHQCQDRNQHTVTAHVSRAIHNAALNSSGDLLCYPQTICWREEELKLNHQCQYFKKLKAVTDLNSGRSRQRWTTSVDGHYQELILVIRQIVIVKFSAHIHA